MFITSTATSSCGLSSLKAFCISILYFSIFSPLFLFPKIWFSSIWESQPFVPMTLLWSASLWSVISNKSYFSPNLHCSLSISFFIGSLWKKHLITILLTSFIHLTLVFSPLFSISFSYLITWKSIIACKLSTISKQLILLFSPLYSSHAP